MATTTLDGHAAEPSFYTAKRGIKHWLYTVDHKRIGMMYLAGVLLAFLAAGVLAIIVRIELMTPAIDFLVPAGAEGADPDTLRKLQVQGREIYNKIFTLHGGLMVFVFIIPSVPAALGNFFLPLMLGAKDVAFPRLNLLSFYIWILGTAILLLAILNGGLDTGWTFYTPYSTGESGTAVITATTGVFVLGFSSILTGLNFVVTVHKMRAPGMTWNRMPLFIQSTQQPPFRYWPRQFSQSRCFFIIEGHLKLYLQPRKAATPCSSSTSSVLATRLFTS